MRHHILVKWKDDITTPDNRAIAEIFNHALDIPGVHSVSLHPNVVDRPNRYDLLILLCMEPSALAVYDACDAHRQWKEQYGGLIAHKVIFDCE